MNPLKLFLSGPLQFIIDTYDITFRPKTFVKKHYGSSNTYLKRCIVTSFEGCLFTMAIFIYLSKDPLFFTYPIIGPVLDALVVLAVFAVIPLVQSLTTVLCTCKYRVFTLVFVTNLLLWTLVSLWLLLVGMGIAMLSLMFPMIGTQFFVIPTVVLWFTLSYFDIFGGSKLFMLTIEQHHGIPSPINSGIFGVMSIAMLILIFTLPNL